MASSVASAREMERWARERAEKKDNTIPMPEAACKSFKEMKPDFAALEKFEAKLHRTIEHREARANQLETAPVINVMGSTAGAGSGDFHTYRGFRTREVARLKDMEDEKKEEQLANEWRQELEEREAVLDAKSKKRAAKREKQKQKKQQEKELKRARIDDGGAKPAECAKDD
mmetsp:Transcript_2356/g.3958  ORF Transcript_2356/g.3958 Transcript_2356/m.3958 type:complete len:172 (+) Transcript_2356:14-529(+)|eukprot:CAMPEP_0119305114 /NCGR_PEP_ID=MMETSP1333-20130426/6188_1 /TAXON_ID=418940 /ORGANISM="Scyphosphaera apsteinii, Strain RCC1455" /LENGTH=171 /DNA_ID=CAMNT_0007308131 /DNA_START=20 /DNA_END=535 /DNA_ORIENTATION=-